MPDVQDSDGHRIKRFRHRSYNEQLKDVHLPSALSRSSIDESIDDNSSHFHTSLNQWMQLNLSASFLSFARQVYPLSQSLPQLVYHSQEIVALWLKCTENAEDEALRALFDLLQKLVHDLRQTLKDSYDKILDCLLVFLSRPISPAALIALLTCLSTLFKHLLALETGSLTSTWTRFEQALRKSKSEVQRAAGEVWATVLRRLKKKDERSSCVELMLSGLDDAGVDDALAWTFVSAIRSVSQTLHSCAYPLVSALLDSHLSSAQADNSERIEKLIKRVLTALIHHCGKPEHFSVIADLVVDRLVSVQQAGAEEVLRLVLEIVATPCSVRRGSRLTSKQHTRVLEITRNIPITPRLYSPLLKATSACLLSSSSDLAVWLGPGRRAIERAWSAHAEFAISLTGTLLDAGWGGLKQFSVPSFHSNVLPFLLDNNASDKSELRAWRVLAKLAKHGHLNSKSGIDEAWKNKLAAWVEARLDTFVVSEKSVLFLKEFLTVYAAVPHSGVHRRLLHLACNLVESDADARESYNASWANEPWTYGILSRFVAKHCSEDDRMELAITSKVERVLKKWGWSDHAMAGVAELTKNVPRSNGASLSEEAVTTIVTLLKSHYQSIRQSALEILSSTLVAPDAGGKLAEVSRRCLTAESVPLTVQGVRERVLRIGRVGQVIQDGDEPAALLCATWLVGQLTVNLRPVWSPAAGAIASLAERFPETVWELVFGDLEAVQTSAKQGGPDWCVASSSKTEGVDTLVDDVEEANEQERSWRDPSAFKFRAIVKSWLSDEKCRKNVIEDQVPRDRFDEGSFEAQLLAALGDVPSLAEKCSRQLVPLFLSFASPHVERKAPRTKLVNWLALFAKFTNPKAFFRTAEIHELYTSLLSHPDRTLQTSALSCLLTYKPPALMPHEHRLRMLLDDSKWRDELAMLDIEGVEEEERKELVPVLIRLFFGMMLERGGHGKGSDRRAALLGTMRSFGSSELALVVDLMLEPFQRQVDLGTIDGSSWSKRVGTIEVPEKQQAGFMVFLGDVMKNIGTMIVSEWPRLLVVLLSITAQAQHKLERNIDPAEDEIDDEENEKSELELVADHTATRQLRTIRQLGLKRLTDFFKSPAHFNFSPYMKEIFRTIISPRLELLDRENTQAPSALLDLFDVWTAEEEYVSFLVDYDARTLTKIYDCFVAKNVKPIVLMRIFDMLERLLTHTAQDSKLADAIIKPYMSHLLNNLTVLIQTSTARTNASTSALAQREVAVLSLLATYVEDGTQAATLLSLFLPQLRKHHKAVPEKVKTDILKIIGNIIPAIPTSPASQALYDSTYDTFAQLLQGLRGRPARMALIQAYHSLAKTDASLANLAELLSSLNAYSTLRLDEPDFDRRLDAFAKINEEACRTFSAKEWSPILHNMLFFVQDEELSIRCNASLAMKRFSEALAKSTDLGMQECFAKVLYTGIKHSLLSKSDLVRVEIIGVLSYAVSTCKNVIALQDMEPLLANGDDEANVFNNIYHIQLHRRTRALRRLADFCDETHFRKSTLDDFFIPLVNGFILSVGSTDHNLVNEAVLTAGRISKHLTWGSYYALVNQYMKLCADHATAEKAYTRALVTVLDNFHFSMEESVDGDPPQPAEGDTENVMTIKPMRASKIQVTVNETLLPALLKHLEQRDEVEDNIRIPVAVGVAKVALHLPEPGRSLQIGRLLTVLSQVFRSKSQDTRDLARETLCRIAASLGQDYLSSVFRQLREALTRGPHLHVLAFVVHAILVHVTSPEHVNNFNRLDDCVPDAAHVSAEVVFGQSGKDVESEGFKTKMKEVRGSSSRGLDSFAIISKHISPTSTANLLRPIKAIMQETESLKSMQLVDEVLRRISSGINSNAHFEPAELLVFCHTLISQNARFFHQKERGKHRTSKKRSVDNIVVQVKRQQVVEDDHYSHNAWRFVCFGLDLFNTAYRRSRFDFQDAKIIARLEPMVTVIGNSLYSTNAQVISAALKAMAHIVKCPLKSIDKSMPVYMKQTMDIIKGAGSTEAETTQVAFKSLAIVLRDSQTAQIKEKDLTYLLELLSPDLEEPSRQASAFALLRAIVARKFIVPEIYDMMDNVSQIMVTSQSTQVQELCRSTLLQFLLDYPQGKGRLNQQITFLVKNLTYVYESGRTSVMELLSACLSKFHDNIIQEYAEMLFIALVMVVANDDSSRCREMAAQLIKNLLTRMPEAQRNSVLSHAHTWATQEGNAALARVSSQVYGLAVDALKTDILAHQQILLEDVNSQILKCAEADLEDIDEGDSQLEWQIPYQSLNTLAKVLQVFPEVTTQVKRVSWSSIMELLVYPHAWVRSAASRLLGTLYSVSTIGVPNEKLKDESPLSLNGMKKVAGQLAVQLKSENLDSAMSIQAIKNLLWIGKCFYEIPHATADSQDDEELSDHSDDGETDEAPPAGDHPLPWLFSKLSYQARSALIARRSKHTNKNNWAEQPSAILRWFAAMVMHMDAVHVERYLMHILAPLYRITDDDTIRDPSIDELKTLALEVQDLLQTKVGTTKFAAVYSRIRQHVQQVRHERRTNRAQQLTTNPEAAHKRKIRKNSLKTEGRKRKNRMFAEHKVRNTTMKRRRLSE